MYEIVAGTRTFRRFAQNEPLNIATLRELIDLARLGGSARNGQPWQYMIVNSPDLCARIFPYLRWAGYLPDWHGPVEGERPSAYVLCLLNRNRLKGPESEAQFDLGIATQNLLLGATGQKIGGCRIGAFNPKLASLFKLADHLHLSLVIALGKPKEAVIIEQCKEEDDVRYWRDEHGVHHVPKRSLTSCLVDIELFNDGVNKEKEPMSTQQTFQQQIDDLRDQVRQLDDDLGDDIVEQTANRLKGLNFSPPVITPLDVFLRMQRRELLVEIERILAMPDAQACALAPDNTKKCEDLRVQFITVLIYYYKKLVQLRKGNPEEWDEIDELYVHD